MSSMKQLSELQQASINCIRFLAADAVQKANSGHPGFPMGFAGPGYLLFQQILKHNPKNPKWVNRDRFVLSAGHGSMLLYSLLHLSGYQVSLEDIKNFRQLGSRTPGHPEWGHTQGVEVTTGPLGQGISTAVGLAIAARYAAARFNRPGFDLIDHHVFAISGDGCLQEGISGEACSLAGHLGLGNLILLYDDNQVTIDGSTSLSFTEDVKKRYEAYGWFVQEIGGDGHNLEAMAQAIAAAKAQDKPSLIKIRSVIGFGSPNKAGTSGVHGSPLGPEEIKLAKAQAGFGEGDFQVPAQVKAHFAEAATRGEAAQAAWDRLLAQYQKEHPALAAEFDQACRAELPSNFDQLFQEFAAGASLATRAASGKVLSQVMPHLPMILGGSADLSPSNNTKFDGAQAFNQKQPQGRYIHYGVREHAMGAIINGISIYGMTRAYGGTFLTFADYMLPAVRVAALSGYPSLYVFTHDSIGVGEDGPTHQPVEQVAYLRALPNLISFRPADANETLYAWKFALKHQQGPVCFCLSRQNLPVLDQSKLGSARGTAKGGYVLKPAQDPQLLILATGSEVALAMEAAQALEAQGKRVQVVSLPSVELFEAQDQAYQDQVIPPQVANRIVVEAGIKKGWEGYLGRKGVFVGMQGFGASAPAEQLYRHFGISLERILEEAARLLG